MDPFTKQTLRKLVSYEDLNQLINNHMVEPSMVKNSSMKNIKAKQKVMRIR